MDVLQTGRSLPGSFLADRSRRYLGTHVLLDIWGANHLDDPNFIREVLGECARACGATLLKTDIHHFGESEGVTGVAMLAESHISIHSWPEHGYAAFDVFVCGSLDPHLAVDALIRRFAPVRTNVIEHRRGLSSIGSIGAVF